MRFKQSSLPNLHSNCCIPYKFSCWRCDSRAFVMIVNFPSSPEQLLMFCDASNLKQSVQLNVVQCNWEKWWRMKFDFIFANRHSIWFNSSCKQLRNAWASSRFEKDWECFDYRMIPLITRHLALHPKCFLRAWTWTMNIWRHIDDFIKPASKNKIFLFVLCSRKKM